jgi:quercetin dioxygenase-like cupin family protein
MAFGFWHSRHDEPLIAVPAIGLELRVTLPGSSAGSVMEVIETVNRPGFGPPLHRHPETEVFRVLSGRYLFEVDGRRFVAETGDLVCAPGGCAHTFVNISDDPGRQLISILPTFDSVAFFTALGKVMANGVPSRDALNEFGKPWRVEFLGPPLRKEDAP